MRPTTTSPIRATVSGTGFCLSSNWPPGVPLNRPSPGRQRVIRDDAEWLDQLADERFRALSVETETGLELDVPGLTASPSPVLRRVLLRALRAASGGREVGLEHVETVTVLLGWRSGRGGPAGKPRGASGPETGVAPAEGGPKVILLRSMLGGEGS